jgi:alcohol dehydrogenase class IV
VNGTHISGGEAALTEEFSQFRSFRVLGPKRIDSGVNALEQLPKIVRSLNAKRLLFATSNSVANKTPHARRVRDLLGDAIVAEFPGCRAHTPEQDIHSIIAALEAHAADAVVSIGGSSVFDAVKVAASRHANSHGINPIPQIAIPTTLSAGEFSPGAGFTEQESGSKQLLLDLRVAPQYVILDPTVTVDTPESLWLSSGVKALDHAMEAIWSRKPHPYVDALALQAIRLLTQYLPQTRGSDDLGARGACQVAAWMSISGVGAAGMRLSHFLGHQIGAHMHIAHGVTSCVLLPTVMRFLRDDTLEAQVRIAHAMNIDRAGRSDRDFAAAAADSLEQMIREMGLPTTISGAGGSIEAIDAVADSSFAAAQSLGLTHDLPNGAQSIRKILMTAWT